MCHTDISAGTLLMEEAPFVTWPAHTGDELLNEYVIKILLRNKNHAIILDHMKHVHPVSLDIVPNEMIVSLNEKFGAIIDKMALEFKSKITRDEIVRLFFALQMSAFGTGIYLHLSLLNHNCYPNCIKFSPDPSKKMANSQIRALRPIKAGEEITISYLIPPEQSLQSRTSKLKLQFGFEPVYSKNEQFKIKMLETAKNPEQDNTALVLELETKIENFDNGTEKPVETAEQCMVVIEELVELRTRAAEALNERHVLIFRLNKLLMELIHRVISEEEPKEPRESVAEEGKEETELTPEEKEKQSEQDKKDAKYQKYLVLYLSTGYEVYRTQLLLFHKDHIDFATTLNDLEMALDTLLSRYPKLLYATFAQWNTFTKATKFRQDCQVEFERLVKLYE